MPLTGDTARLARLAKKLREASKVEFLKKAFGTELAETASDLYQKSFSSQTAPLGDKWPASPHGMVLTGALANPTTEFKGTQLVVDAGSYVAIFHQAGWQVGGERITIKGPGKRDTKGRFQSERRTVRVGGTQAGPPRPVLPTKNSAGQWEKPLQQIIERGVTEFFSSF